MHYLSQCYASFGLPDLFKIGDQVCSRLAITLRIEGGILTGSIEGRLRPRVQANIGAVETQVNNMLKELDFHQWTDVYLMPAAAAVAADFSGSLDDDVTIVLPFQSN